jgi:thioredoxin-related protein
MNTKRVFIAAFALVVIAVGALSASMMLANAGYSPHDGEKWHTDFSQAQTEAQSAETPILLYVYQDGCAGCEEFNTRLQNNENLQSAVDRYVMVSADIAASPELADRYDVEVTPRVVILTPEGEAVTAFNPNVKDTPTRLASAYETAMQ